MTPMSPTPLFVQTQISGIILDENGIAFEGVEVTWGKLVVSSDANGFFAFPEGPANADGTVVQIRTNGYFTISKTVRPLGKAKTWLDAQLTPQTLSGTFQANAGGVVNLPDAKLTLPAGGILNKDNLAYSGTVNVYAIPMDPTKPLTLATMPGNFSAIGANGNKTVLSSYGMIGVELKSPSGESLKLATNASAEISLKIPSTLQSSAPSKLSLFNFDPNEGKWVKEGTADKVGTSFVGSVKHFSFWTVAEEREAINLDGKVVDNNGAPVTGVYVRVMDAGVVVGSGQTNNAGEFAVQVPANISVTIDVLDNCGDIITSKQIGPFSADAEIPNLVANLSGKAIKLTGILIDCGGDTTSAGYIIVDIEYTRPVILTVDADGYVNAVVTHCGASQITVTGYGTGDSEPSIPATYQIAGLNTLDLGEIETLCWVIVPWVSFTLDGVTASLQEPSISGGIDGTSMWISGTDPASLDSTTIYITLEATSPGTYTPTSVYVSVLDLQTGTFRAGSCSDCSNMEVEITSVGNVGERIEGSFTGTLEFGVPLTGSFNIERE